MVQNSLGPPTWEYEDIVRQAQKQMKTAENEEILAGIAHEILIETGSLQPTLTSLIEYRDISLVVVGTHGRTGIKKLLLGSVAEEIFRLASCPVMTIGPHESPGLLTHGRFRSVVYATDFSTASHQALPYALLFAQESQARLTLMHAMEEGSVAAIYLHERFMAEARKRLEDLVPVHANIAFPPDVEVISSYPVEGILKVAEKKEADLIVMGAHRSGGIGALASAHLPWTIAQAVAGHAKCPVLTVRG